MDSNSSINWQDVRNQFPYLEEKVYLNAAGMTPLPVPVYEAGKGVLEKMHLHTKDFAEQLFVQNVMAHQKVAKFYNASPNDIAFVQTTSLGMNLLALHFKNRFQDKRKVVTLDDEFPSSTLPWAHHGFELDFVQPSADHRYDITRILDRVDSSTAAVVASYVQFGTGVRVEIAALADALKTKGVPLVLNATQAAGVLPIDVKALGVDAMVASGNKWLMAGVGAAMLYVSEALRSEAFPPFAGWLSANPISLTNNRLGKIGTGASSLELGLNSFVPVRCLEAAIGYIQSIGVENVRQRVLELSTHLIASLQDCKAQVVTPSREIDRLGIVTVMREDAAGWVDRLKKKDVIVVLRGDRHVRISPHIYNNENDINALLEAW